ncbi:hypothetical protein RLIN73S_04314 [Rhodanobacter lindaniclasticus]
MKTSDPQAARAATLADPRWIAVRARDARADGSFFYSVRTTGVYCRPSCAARPARPENVAFHASAAEAERAGFRPCKRCKPDQPSLAEQHAALLHRRLPADRASRDDAHARTVGEAERTQPVPLSSRVQGGHRRDPEAVRDGAAQPPRAQRAGPQCLGDRGDLRRRLQRQQPLLRKCGPTAGHDALQLPRRRRRQHDPLRHRRMLAGGDPGGAERTRRVRDPARRRSGRAGARPAGSLPRRPG